MYLIYLKSLLFWEDMETIISESFADRILFFIVMNAEIELGFNYRWHLSLVEIDFKRQKMRRIHPERRVDKCSERIFIQTYLHIQMLSDQKKKRTDSKYNTGCFYLFINIPCTFLV